MDANVSTAESTPSQSATSIGSLLDSQELTARFLRMAERSRREQAEREASLSAMRAAERTVQAQRWWQMSDVPPRFWHADLRLPGIVNPRHAAVRSSLLATLNRPGLLALVGTTGTGKTWLSCGLVREFCRAGRGARYANTQDLLKSIRATYQPKAPQSERDVVRPLQRMPLLVLDEFHVRADTEWERTQLMGIIDARYAGMLTTIIVSNLQAQPLLESMGRAFEGRLRESGAIHECVWPSFRDDGQDRGAAIQYDTNGKPVWPAV